MKTYRLGFIGCGNMGKAMLAGALEKGWTEAEKIVVHTHSQQSMEALVAQYGVDTTKDNRSVAEQAEIIILAVKPNLYQQVLEDIREVLQPGQMVLAIAPSYSLATLAALVGHEGVGLVRAMPNTPAQIGCGMTGVVFSAQVQDEDRKAILSFFEAFGVVKEVSEPAMHGVCAVSGSAPAYGYMVIEAMAEGAIRQGIAAKDAYVFAAQAMLGAAQMVLTTGQHPAALRDAVCSPGGTTIEAVAALERAGLKNALLEGMDACAAKSKQMEAAACEGIKA